MKIASAWASTSEPIVKYRPRKRNIGTATSTAKITANTPPAAIDGTSARPAESDSFVVAYEPIPTNAETARDTWPPLRRGGGADPDDRRDRQGHDPAVAGHDVPRLRERGELGDLVADEELV